MAVVSLAWYLITVSTDQVEKASQPCKAFQTSRQELIKASAAFEAAPNEKSKFMANGKPTVICVTLLKNTFSERHGTRKFVNTK